MKLQRCDMFHFALNFWGVFIAQKKDLLSISGLQNKLVNWLCQWTCVCLKFYFIVTWTCLHLY